MRHHHYIYGFRLLFVLLYLSAAFASNGIANIAHGDDDVSQSKHALLIDIRNYAYLKSRGLNADLTDLRRTLHGEDFDVKFIQDGTRRKVNQLINDLLYRADSNDIVIIAINAGVVTTDRSDEVYLLFQDTRIEDIEVDGLSLRSLDTVLDRMSTPNQLLALTLDSLGTKIHGESGKSSRASLGPTREELQSLIAEQLSILGKDRIVLSEIDSRDEQTTDAGSLATLIASGIKGEADIDKDSSISIEELQQYVEQHSKHAPVIQGYADSPVFQSSKLIRTTPITNVGVTAAQPLKLATRSITLAVLTDEAAARHKEVLADWVVDGLLSRGDNFRLYSFMSKIMGKTKEDIAKPCYDYYKTVEPTLQDAYLLLRDINRNQLKNLVVAETMKQQLSKLPATCTGK